MNTLTPNKLEQARNQVSKLKTVEVPSEIAENEKGYYHVLIIDSKPNPRTMEYDHKVKKQVINRESFEKNKQTYKQLGYSNFVIFHDPVEQRKADLKKAQEEAEKKAKAKAEKEAKAKAEKKAKAQEEAEKETEKKSEDKKPQKNKK